MREDWGPTVVPSLQVSSEGLTKLIQPVFPQHSVTHWETTHGGLANHNVRIWIDGQDRTFLIRFIIRDPREARKEYNLNRLLRPGVPVPEFLYFYDQNPITGHPCILMEWVEGERLDRIVQSLSTDEIAIAGQSIGTTLAHIHSNTFKLTGFLDSNLDVATPISVGSDGLVGYLETCLTEGRGIERLGAELTSEVIEFAKTHGKILDAFTGPACLAHCDFGGSNILMKKSSIGWSVAAVLDWEFAFAGTPFLDFGNLLRPPLGELPGFADAVVTGYRSAGANLPERWRQMSRITDLLAWADFMNREVVSPGLIRDAVATIRQTIAAG